MAAKPKLTASSPEIQNQLVRLRDDVATLVSELPTQGREQAQQAVDTADELTKGNHQRHDGRRAQESVAPTE